jgi:hypothetical protein
MRGAECSLYFVLLQSARQEFSIQPHTLLAAAGELTAEPMSSFA